MFLTRMQKTALELYGRKMRWNLAVYTIKLQKDELSLDEDRLIVQYQDRI